MFEFIGNTLYIEKQRWFKWWPMLLSHYHGASALSRFAGRLSALMPRAGLDVSHFWVLHGAHVVHVRASFWRKYTFSWAELHNHV